MKENRFVNTITCKKKKKRFFVFLKGQGDNISYPKHTEFCSKRAKKRHIKTYLKDRFYAVKYSQTRIRYFLFHQCADGRITHWLAPLTSRNHACSQKCLFKINLWYLDYSRLSSRAVPQVNCQHGSIFSCWCLIQGCAEKLCLFLLLRDNPLLW